jgi:hypothetical protein
MAARIRDVQKLITGAIPTVPVAGARLWSIVSSKQAMKRIPVAPCTVFFALGEWILSSLQTSGIGKVRNQMKISLKLLHIKTLSGAWGFVLAVTTLLWPRVHRGEHGGDDIDTC